MKDVREIGDPCTDMEWTDKYSAQNFPQTGERKLNQEFLSKRFQSSFSSEKIYLIDCQKYVKIVHLNTIYNCGVKAD